MKKHDMRSLSPSAIRVYFFVLVLVLRSSWRGQSVSCILFQHGGRLCSYRVGSGPIAQTREQMQRISESLSEVDETDQNEDQMKIK